MRRVFTLLAFLLFVSSAFAQYGTQFENRGFEQWANFGSGSNTYEPVHWHSGMSASGGYAWALSKQIDESSQTRPGSSGSKSVRIWPKAALGVTANGNFLNGRMNAGGPSATHSNNYNYTQRSDERFNTPISVVPDSITVWVCFRCASSTQRGQIHAAVHGDADYKIIANGTEEPSDKLVATALMNFTRTSEANGSYVWRRLTVPFENNGPCNDPRYILVCMTTNETPGQGGTSDDMYIDDVLLIYNPQLATSPLSNTQYLVGDNITVGFTLSGTMSPENLNASANQVILQLSNANGSFANPTELGRVTTNTSGSISATIPEVAEGTNYRVRVVSTNYPMVAADNGQNITIAQPGPDPDVTIALGEIGVTTITASFTPNESCPFYSILAVTASEMQSWINSTGLPQELLIYQRGITCHQNTTHTWTGMTPETAYTVYALPISADSIFFPVRTVVATTLPVQGPDPDVTISLGEIGVTSITASFTPNNACASYSILAVTASEMQSWINSTGLTEATLVHQRGIACNQSTTHTWNELSPETAYTVYALPLAADGTFFPIRKTVATTLPVPGPDPDVTISLGIIGITTVSASFTPNETCASYSILAVTASEMQSWINSTGLSEQMLVYQRGISCQGNATHTWTEMAPETQYTIYALPIAANGTFFPVRKAVATTLPAPAPGTSVIALEVQVLNWDAAQTTATPNEETVTFHVGVMTKEHFDEIGEFAAVQAIRNDNSPLTGTDVHTWNELEAETVYYAIATGKNEAGEWGETSIVAFATGPDSVAAYDAVAFEAYPNPANESVKIVGGNINSIEVFNSFGQKVDAIWATGTEALISTQSLENGIYFVRVNGNAVVRIVVRH